MGVVIKATGTSTSRSVKSSIAHASIAAKECIRSANIEVADIDVLINVGVFRDDNMCEPSMAALIQKEIGLNPDYVKFPTKKPAFSFDIMNGACGALNAIQIASAALTSDGAEHVLIVSSDAHPSNADAADFPYAAAGAAMLLAKDDAPNRGFSRVSTLDGPDGFPGTAAFLDHHTMGTGGRGALTVKRHPEYAHWLLDFAAASALAYAQDEAVDLSETLLVTTRATPTFGRDLARKLGISAEHVATIPDFDGDPHSSAVTLAYHASVASGQAARFSQILFLAAGAGLTSACALYRA